MSNAFFYEPFYDFDRLFEEAFSARRGEQSQSNNELQQRRDAPVDGAVRLFKPRMDLHEDTQKNILTASFELPGVEKQDVQIDVHNNRLTVSAETKHSQDFKQGGFAVRERRVGKLSRTLQLPQGVKDEDIKASMENGLLTITFPKVSAETTPKKITIS